MTEDSVLIRQITTGDFEVSVTEEMYAHLLDAADFMGFDSVGSFVSESLLLTH